MPRNALDESIEPATLRECIMYGGLDGRIFSYQPQANQIFYRVLDVKADIASGAKLLVYEDQILDRIDFDEKYASNKELSLPRHLNDRVAKEYVPEMIHKQMHVKGPGFGFGIGVVVAGRRPRGQPSPEEILKSLPGINPKQIE